MSSIFVIGESGFPQVATLYRECGYHGEISNADTVIVVEVGETVAAAVRLCQESGVIVLRGMQVLPRYQRQGFGSRLLSACVPYLNTGATYCLPYAHLAAFYGVIGFKAVRNEVIPQFLRDRQAGYQSSGIDTISMSRLAPNNSFKPNPHRGGA